MRKFWNWLFPPKPQKHFAPRLRVVIESRRPDLLAEFDALGGKSVRAFSAFLDRNFPRRDGGWGKRPVSRLDQQVQHYLDNPQ